MRWQILFDIEVNLSSGVQGAARAFFRNSRKATLVASQQTHNPHRAVMLAVFAAAGR